MNKKQKLLLGMCPIGKFIFSHEDAIKQKQGIINKLNEWNVNYCSIDSIIPDGMVRDQSQVESVVDYFKEKKIDALFIPHCNFGTEGAAGIIAKKLGIPVLLWGPRDEAPMPDGSRLRDSLCGMFATSKVLSKLKVPFTYIENCSTDDVRFKDGVSIFIRAAAVAKAIRTMKIGQIGTRIDFFWSTICNESELLEKFGIQIQPFDMVEFIKAVVDRSQKYRKEYEQELLEVKEWLNTDEGPDDSCLIRSLSLRDELLDMAEKNNLDALSIQTFNSIPRELGSGMGLGYSMAQDKIVVINESDLHGAISSVMLKAASAAEEPCFFPDIVSRHPENDNGVLLWHGSAPLSLRHPECSNIKMHPPWTLKHLTPSSLSFRLKEGQITVCRFDGDAGQYRLGTGEGKTIAGPYTREFYTWVEVENWPQWERKLIDGPYIHHCSCVYDNCSNVLEEACKYIPGLEPDRFDRG